MDAWIRQELNKYSADFTERHLKKSLAAWSHMPKQLEEKLDTVMVGLLRIIPPNISVEKKVALLYWGLTGQINYDKAGMDAGKSMPYSMLGGLWGRKAVCMGLAELFSYMCYLIDIPAITVAGYLDCRKEKTADPEEGDDHGHHAWNMVKLSDGRYYHLDLAGDLHTPHPRWRPSWFLKSDKQMYDHYWIPEDYPKADRPYPGQIQISQEGVDRFCQHWKALLEEAAS